MTAFRTLRRLPQRHPVVVCGMLPLLLAIVSFASMPKWTVHGHDGAHATVPALAIDASTDDHHHDDADEPVVPLPDGSHVHAHCLGEAAHIELSTGPNQISRESGKRRVVITANVRGRDLGSFADELRDAVAVEVSLPQGCWIDYGGTFEQLISASQRLQVVVPIVLLLVFGLLFMAFGSARDVRAQRAGRATRRRTPTRRPRRAAPTGSRPRRCASRSRPTPC